MKTREISKILKSRIPVEEKREILEKAINKKSKAKKAAGIGMVALIATGVTKIVADKIKERKIIKEIEEQEEAEFWEDYYDDFENVPVDQETDDEDYREDYEEAQDEEEKL